MAEESIKVNFDKEEDIISLFRIGKKSKFSLDFELPNGDIVVDYGFDGSIVGLEIFNASNYFPVLKKVEVSEKLKGNLIVQYGRNWAQIFFEISSPRLKNPISNSIISPYNKKIILVFLFIPIFQPRISSAKPINAIIKITLNEAKISIIFSPDSK